MQLKKNCPNLPGPMWKSNYSLNLITGCTTNFTTNTQAWLLLDLLNHLYWTCLTKWSMLKDLKKQHIMPQCKEIQERMRNVKQVIDMYQSETGYKAISTALRLQQTKVRAIIHKCRKLGTVVNLPRSGWPTKITPRAQQQLIQEVIKKPRTTSKELQASLESWP